MLHRAPNIIYLFKLFLLFYLVSNFSRDQLTKQKKKSHKKPHLAAVFDIRTIIVTIQLALYSCAYNIDDLYHTGRIDPPGMVKVVSENKKSGLIIILVLFHSDAHIKIIV